MKAPAARRRDLRGRVADPGGGSGIGRATALAGGGGGGVAVVDSSRSGGGGGGAIAAAGGSALFQADRPERGGVARAVKGRLERLGRMTSGKQRRRSAGATTPADGPAPGTTSSRWCCQRLLCSGSPPHLLATGGGRWSNQSVNGSPRAKRHTAPPFLGGGVNSPRTGRALGGRGTGEASAPAPSHPHLERGGESQPGSSTAGAWYPWPVGRAGGGGGPPCTSRSDDAFVSQRRL